MNDFITFETPLLRGRFIVYNQRPDIDFLKVKQTHSNIVLEEDSCQNQPEADGILGHTQIPKAILTADCVPIVVIGDNKHAVIHAGWRGLQQNILTNDVVNSIKPSYAFIGPHIGTVNYEVQKDFIPNFKDYPNAFHYVGEKVFFNLESVVTAQLLKAFPGIAITDCGLCTFSESKFHSYRRDKTTQRNWNVYFPN